MTRMGSTSQLSETSASSTKRFGKGIIRASKKSTVMHSDYYDDEKEDESSNGLSNQRSISLSALHSASAPLEPRMAQLETLEAKMASIEVSLSTTTSPRRKKMSSGTTTPTPNTPTPNINNSNTNSVASIYRTSKDIAKELDMLRNTLRDKENVINSLKGQLCTSMSIGRLSANNYLQRQNQNNQPLNEKERKAAEDRLNKLRSELDAKRLAMKNIKLSLERLDITDNIDVRIQQAELEYQLGREELNLLSILEESRNLQACLEDAAQNKESDTIFGYMKDSSAVTLHAVELPYDPKSPRFGAGPKEDASGLFIEWATEDSGLQKGDRLFEVNGKSVLSKSKEDMIRLLTVSPDPAQLVVLRKQPSHLDQLMTNLQAELSVVREKAGEAERTRDSFRSDNVRLTHRISYLEEQVAELLERAREDERKSPIMSSASSVKSGHTAPASPKPEVQVFQKGPQVTALVANLPGLEVGSKPQADSSIVLPTMKPKLKQDSVQDVRSIKSLDLGGNESSRHLHRSRESSKKRESGHLQPAQSTNSLDTKTKHHSKSYHRSTHHHPHYHHMNSSMTNDSSSTPRLEKSNSSRVLDYNSESSLIDQRRGHSHRHTPESHRIHLEQRQRHIREARSSLFDYIERDKSSSKSLDFDSEPGYSYGNQQPAGQTPHHAHQKSLDYSSESLNHFKKQSEHRAARPVPPKKPLRLSLHRATSLQSVENGSEKKTLKRNHKGEAPPIPQSALNWSSPTPGMHSANHVSNKSNEKWC
ncbi:hypothetical protein LSTR_LSTR008876 [Laodelphax striatellus]|uniref:PDZ domain-containing protein n=1 Tax=Laodelphax striatellus TaxID=195883 RepID=A0A482WLA5_LAOST|nr:hypothetical protein LSTR_LSTR008876 [Laodelphax striatellus]